MSIPFIDLKSQQARIRDKIDAGLAAVLDHGAYIMGPEIIALEERLAEWSGAKHNISCSSATQAATHPFRKSRKYCVWRPTIQQAVPPTL